MKKPKPGTARAFFIPESFSSARSFPPWRMDCSSPGHTGLFIPTPQLRRKYMKTIEFPLSSGFRANFPKRIIMHAMAENIISEDGIVRPAAEYLQFAKKSAHRLACPNGDIIVCRRDDHGAAHALNFNKDSLGIEALVPGTHDYASFLKAIKRPYLSEEQYESIFKQVHEWYQLWPIESFDRHSDVDPARKKDPGDGFPWLRLRADLGLT